jgi:hypothetical protein
MSGDKYVVEQSHITAHDVVARDKIVKVIAPRKLQIEQYMEQLFQEVAENRRVKDTCDNLKYFFEKQSVDGIDGLENKLDHAGRGHQKKRALRRKELFAKLLDRYGFYSSAQSIFAILLAKIENDFETIVEPMLQEKSSDEIDLLVQDAIVTPLVQTAPAGVFSITHNDALGMVFWLAEQCYVRWHKVENVK